MARETVTKQRLEELLLADLRRQGFATVSQIVLHPLAEHTMNGANWNLGGFNAGQDSSQKLTDALMATILSHQYRFDVKG
jgi:hypothetical protein